MIEAGEPHVTRHGHVRKTLRAWREERGKTMQRLAEEATLSLSAIDGLEHGRTQPSVEVAGKLAEALDVYIEQIIWLKPAGLSRPPSKLLRQFPDRLQIEMATAIIRVVKERVAIADAVAQLEKRLVSLGASGDEVTAAVARVQHLLAEEHHRQHAKALEAQITDEIRRDPTLSDWSVQGIVEAPSSRLATDTSGTDTSVWRVRLLAAHVGNLPRDVTSYEEWEQVKAEGMRR